jgi:hypothetical protein
MVRRLQLEELVQIQSMEETLPDILGDRSRVGSGLVKEDGFFECVDDDPAIFTFRHVQFDLVTQIALQVSVNVVRKRG